MSMDLGKMIKEAMTVSIAERKLKNGVELTDEEKDSVLQRIYSEAKHSLKSGKDLRDTKTTLAFKGLSIVSRMMGDSGKGYHDASVTLSTSTKNNIDNYRRVLEGVSITAENQIPENFQSLISQYEASAEYTRIMKEFVLAFSEANNKYKKDYQSPIAPELSGQMEAKREEVVELSTRYIKK